MVKMETGMLVIIMLKATVIIPESEMLLETHLMLDLTMPTIMVGIQELLMELIMVSMLVIIMQIITEVIMELKMEVIMD